MKNSPYSKAFNVPLSVYGILWFAFALALSWKQSRKTDLGRSPRSEFWVSDDVHFTMLIMWIGVGILSVFYFLFLEFIIGAMCPLCTIVHFVIFMMAWRAYKLHQRRVTLNPRARIVTEPALIISGAKNWILAGAFALAIALVLFNTVLDTTEVAWNLGPSSSGYAGQPINKP